MGRKFIIAMLLVLILAVTVAWAAPEERGIAGGAAAMAASLQGSVAVLVRIARGITEPIGLVLGGICVIAFSWVVGRKMSRLHR